MQRFGKALCALVAGLVVTISLASWAPAQAQAQSWPQRPVRFIVSLGPGSGADIAARLIADKLTAKWKQPVVVENRPGGDAVIAINAFIGAKDDHVLLYTPTSSFTAHPFQMAKMPYDPNDLGPIARVSNTLVGLVVHAALEDRHVKDFVAQIKAQPGKLNYATATGMTDVIFEGYFKSAGLDITRVPYRDVVGPLTDLGEGRIQAYVGALAIVQPHVQAGRVKLIAVTNSQRAPTQKDTPTVAEAGFPALTFDGLIGLFGPRDMPEAVRDRIAADVKEAVADPDLGAAHRDRPAGQPRHRRGIQEVDRRAERQAWRDREAARRQAAVALNLATTSSGIGLRAQAARAARVARHPAAGLVAFHRERAGERELVLDGEARTADPDERGLDLDIVAVARREQKTRLRRHRREPAETVLLVEGDFLHAKRPLDQEFGRVVEHGEIARIEDDAGGIAIAPFDADRTADAEHAGTGSRALTAWHLTPPIAAP